MKCQPTQILSFQCFSQSMKQQLQSQLTVSPETGERPEKKELKIRLCRLSPVYNRRNIRIKGISCDKIHAR